MSSVARPHNLYCLIAVSPSLSQPRFSRCAVTLRYPVTPTSLSTSIPSVAALTPHHSVPPGRAVSAAALQALTLSPDNAISIAPLSLQYSFTPTSFSPAATNAAPQTTASSTHDFDISRKYIHLVPQKLELIVQLPFPAKTDYCVVVQQHVVSMKHVLADTLSCCGDPSNCTLDSVIWSSGWITPLHRLFRKAVTTGINSPISRLVNAFVNKFCVHLKKKHSTFPSAFRLLLRPLNITIRQRLPKAGHSTSCGRSESQQERCVPHI